MELHGFSFFYVKVLLESPGALGVQLTLGQLGPALLPRESLGAGQTVPLPAV